MKVGGGGGEGRKEGFLPFFPTPFFAPSLTLVPRSLFLNRTETLATQAKLGIKSYLNLDQKDTKKRILKF